MAFVLPSKREVGVLSPDIAGEGAKVLMVDGEVITFNPSPPKPVMPDWSEIKSIRHYFNRTGFKVFPAWLYHPTEQPRIVKDAHEAAELGVCWREATIEEKGRYGLEHVWDWKEDCEWRQTPFKTERKYDPRKPEQGKEYIATPVAQATANRELLNTVLPEVTAAVVAALKQGGSVAPDKIDPKQWESFLAFQAWQKTQQAIDLIAPVIGNAAEGNALAPTEPIPEENERALWEAEAERKGIKVDGRWSLERLKAAVDKAA